MRWLYSIHDISGFHFFNAANRFANSSTSGILPPTMFFLAPKSSLFAVLSASVPDVCFFNPLIFAPGFKSGGPGSHTPAPARTSGSHAGGATLTGDLGPRSRGGVALLNSSVVKGSSRAFTAWPPEGVSSSSSSWPSGDSSFFGQFTP